MPFRFTGPLNEQPLKVADKLTETGRLALTGIEYAPVASVVAASVAPPVSFTLAPASAPPPGPVTWPEIEIDPTTADETLSADSPSGADCCVHATPNAIGTTTCASKRPRPNNPTIPLLN